MALKHLSKMTPEQMLQMQAAVQEAAIQYTIKNGFSGLSHNGWFNFYSALQNAVEGEWLKATKKKRDGAYGS